MEDPGTWSILTSSLSVADLNDAERTWEFLRAYELVNESPDGVVRLAQAIKAEVDRGRITGGSLAYRVAERLIEAGLTPGAAKAPDPFGTIAAARWATFREGPGSFRE
ncbi:MAG: hypothetical protein L0Y58_00020 [Verrucomicrobia subdivision 3 bacterium]|nr:hypothetical protein [Limisphaerales bacterium]